MEFVLGSYWMSLTQPVEVPLPVFWVLSWMNAVSVLLYLSYSPIDIFSPSFYYCDKLHWVHFEMLNLTILGSASINNHELSFTNC